MCFAQNVEKETVFTFQPVTTLEIAFTTAKVWNQLLQD